MTNAVLICTVGGSHQPVVTAIETLAPGFVCFLCTGKDPETGKPGSDRQIEGAGSVIKAHYEDTKASLPNIPIQARLGADAYEVMRVPADDLDGAFVATLKAFENLRARFPQAHLVADYTGGTKTMTAALVAAALERIDVDLQLVAGTRADLVKVRDGTQHGVPATVESARLKRRMAPFLEAWGRYAYDEAAVGLAGIPTPRKPDLRPGLSRAIHLSRAFAAWDRFDHARALQQLEDYRTLIGQHLGVHLLTLKGLTEPGKGQEPARILDLWRNAERRAAQGRYDDAVARLYRLLEWSAQWLLRAFCGIETADVDPARVPADIELTTNRRGQRQAGLFTAWRLVEHCLPDSSAAAFFGTQREVLNDHLNKRNQSILAHGFEPVTRQHWDDFSAWIESHWLATFLVESRACGIKQPPPQLPARYLWDD